MRASRPVHASASRRLLRSTRRSGFGGLRSMPHWRAPVRGVRLVPFRARESLAQPPLYVETAAKPRFAKACAALAADPWLQTDESVLLERLRRRGGVQ
jgi:hypothetical protein